MTDILITDFQIGEKKNGISVWAYIWAWTISLPFKILMFFIPKKQNYLSITGDNWTEWVKINDILVQRKAVAETGFDGVIKFYNLKSDNQDLNKLLNGKFFGSFITESNYGIFLREFDNPNDWPISYLSLIDKDFKSINRLRKIDSSWTEWRFESLDKDSFNIVTHPAKEYTKGIKITNPNKS